jgi:hypothetical protein
MIITDLEHLILADQITSVKGAALAYASSSSVATTGYAGSGFQAVAVGNSSTNTWADVKLRTISVPKFSFSSASTSVSSYARD